MPRTNRSCEVEAEISTLIKSGVWPVGYRIGTHREIADRFQCSRSDVNRALVCLRDLGLVKAIGGGTGPNITIVCGNGDE